MAIAHIPLSALLIPLYCLPSSLATYHCNPGYILWGNASRLCSESGSWSGVTPQCKPITCGQPPEIPNARSTLVNGSTLWRSFASYECKPGFRMVLPEKGECKQGQMSRFSSANPSASRNFYRPNVGIY